MVRDERAPNPLVSKGFLFLPFLPGTAASRAPISVGEGGVNSCGWLERDGSLILPKLIARWPSRFVLEQRQKIRVDREATGMIGPDFRRTLDSSTLDGEHFRAADREAPKQKFFRNNGVLHGVRLLDWFIMLPLRGLNLGGFPPQLEVPAVAYVLPLKDMRHSRHVEGVLSGLALGLE